MLFEKKSNKNTRCAFGFHDDGISFVRLSFGKKAIPNIDSIEFFPGEPNLHAVLLKKIIRSHNLKKSICSTYIENSSYQLLVTDAPDVPKDEIISALQWELKDLLTLPLEQSTLTMFDIPEQTATKKIINVVSASKEKIADIAQIFEEAKLTLGIIDIEEFALRNLAILDSNEKNGIVTLWLSGDYGKILFIHNSNIHLSRNIEFGYKSISHSLNGMENIALEVQRSIDYFERHYNKISIQSLLLMPFELESSGFNDFLENNLTLPCNEFKLKENSAGLETVSSAIISKSLLAIGTGLRQRSKDY